MLLCTCAQTKRHRKGGSTLEGMLTLRGGVVSVYGSIAKFAQKVGWSYAKAYRIATGGQIPDLNDMKTICAALQIESPDDICRLFSLP